MPFVSTLDFGARTVIALIAQRKPKGGWDILGGGDVEARGVENGEVRHTGDAVDCVVEALRRAERSAGEKIKTLYFNFSHSSFEGIEASGAKHLTGEGQIRSSDIRDGKEAALRMVGSFEKNVIYAKESGFLIDEKDAVLNPVGIYGQRLDVFLYALTADSAVLDQWKKVMRRSYMNEAYPVLSAWSVAYGVLPAAERMKKNFILDLHDGVMNAILFEGNGIRDYAVFAQPRLEGVMNEWLEKHKGLNEILVTGEGSKDETVLNSLKEGSSLSIRPVSAIGIPRLSDPAHVAAAGLLDVAEELDKQKPAVFEGTSFLSGLKEKAESYWNEYF